MRYCSTRGLVNNQTFEEVLFNNYTSNGGIFIPESIPNVDLKTLHQWSTFSYVELCKVISRLFISEEEIPTTDLNGKVYCKLQLSVIIETLSLCLQAIFPRKYGRPFTIFISTIFRFVLVFF